MYDENHPYRLKPNLPKEGVVEALQRPDRKPQGRHTLPVDYPVLKVSEIGALNAAVVAIDAAVADGYTRRTAAQSRRAALEQRLAGVPVVSADGACDLDASLADALVADPGSTLTDDDLAAATQRRVETRRAREATVAQREIIAQAIGKVDGEIVSIESEIEHLKEERVFHWKAFLEAAHTFLMDRFRTEFTALVENTLQAAVDLQSIEIEGRQLVPYTAWKVERKSAIKILRRNLWERWSDNLAEPDTGYEDDRSVLFGYDYASAIVGSSPAIDRFRASLPKPKA